MTAARTFMRQTVLANGLLVGVYGVEDPVAALRSAGVQALWHGENVAFGGSGLWMTHDRSAVGCGDIVLDNLDELRTRLDLPEAGPGEIFAQLFACYGPEAAANALGMFGVAVWDERKKTLTLIRDSVGARTVYYSLQGNACWFSVRLSTLRRCPGVSAELSLSAIRNYLTCAFVPGEETLYRDIKELRPGEAITFPGPGCKRYWAPRTVDSAKNEGLESHAARLRPLLEECVRARLPKSGEVGVLLSGGLDSSIVTALAAREAPGRLRTFAIHFGTDLPNELEFSGLVASHCGTKHHVLELPGRAIRDTLIETMGALDDPIGDPLTTPNLLLARAVKQVSDVTLNGEGGDPCFGGPKNLPMLLHELYGSSEPRETAYLRSFQKCYDDLPRLLSPAVQRALRHEAPAESILAPYFDDAGSPMSYLDRLMMINVQMKGADQILTKVNNLFSAAGVVARSPLFDRRIVEAGFAIPAEYKLDGAVEKAVLKEAARDLLPEAILDRPKSGMLVPVQRWFKKELKSYARGMLLSRRARIRPYLEQSMIREWLAYDGAVWQRNGVKLWLVLALEAWLRAHEG
jgi:asparagine synthase (glutamine-hydrolysing)